MRALQPQDNVDLRALFPLTNNRGGSELDAHQQANVEHLARGQGRGSHEGSSRPCPRHLTDHPAVHSL